MTAGNQTSAKAIQDDEQAIRSVVGTWLRASERGDLETILNLMEDDIVFITPGREPFGREGFVSSFEQVKNSKMDATSEIQEIRVLGDWAWLHNFLRIKMTPANGSLVNLSGHVLSIFRKGQDGRWRLARDANQVMPEKE